MACGRPAIPHNGTCGRPRRDPAAPLSPSAARERVAFWAYGALRWLGSTLSASTGRRVFRALSSSAYHLLPNLRGVVAANQAQVLGLPSDDPRVRASTREAFALYGR